VEESKEENSQISPRFKYVRTQISENVAKYLAKKLKSNIILIHPCSLDYVTI